MGVPPARSIQVQFTIDDGERGDAIVEELLTRRLVACAQTVGTVTSRYWWDGSVNRAQEWLYLCKTTPARLQEVVDCIRLGHPYDVPEVIACDITGGLDAYVDWIVATTQPGDAPDP